MFVLSVQHKLKILGIALAVPLSLFLTLTAMLDLHPAQASQQLDDMPLMSNAPSSEPLTLHSPRNVTAPSGDMEVSISGFAFNPQVITITAGTVVTWTNLDGANHTTTSDVGSSDPWDSGSLGTNGIFTKTFNIPGSYPYHCGIHTSMHGTVIVLAEPAQQAPLAVNVNGPSDGVTEIPYTFTATVAPLTTTQPITYIWQATGQTTVTRTDKGLSDTVTFTWAALSIGSQAITVTALNSAGSISTTHSVDIAASSKIHLPLILR